MHPCRRPACYFAWGCFRYFSWEREPLRPCEVRLSRRCLSDRCERLVPLAGIEPALLAELDFESSASTNSATGAFRGACRRRGPRSGRNIAGAPCRSTRRRQIDPQAARSCRIVASSFAKTSKGLRPDLRTRPKGVVCRSQRVPGRPKHPSVIALGSTAPGPRVTTLPPARDGPFSSAGPDAAPRERRKSGQILTLHGVVFDILVGSCPYGRRERWCPWPESNQHSLRNSILSRARLPIPPQGLSDIGQEVENWLTRG